MAPAAAVELTMTDPGDCRACADRLREGLSNHRGIVGVEPIAGRDAIMVSYDPDLCSLDCLDATATELRIDLEGAYQHRVSRLEGMDCADCAQTIERAVTRMDGVTNVAVSFPASTMRVEYQPAVIDFPRIAGQVGRLGYRVEGAEEQGSRRRLATWANRDNTTRLAAVLLVLALLVDFATGLTAIPLYAAAALAGGLPLARSGVAALVATRRPDINLLMTIAVIGAAVIGAWLEAALVVVLFATGELLESRAVDRARRELASLVSLAPETARVRRRRGSGPLALVQEIDVDVAEVMVGEVVIIRPGERIPIDGVVREGASAVDQAPITGESTPVDKVVGDPVFAGTLNAQGLLVVQTTTAPGDTTLARIGKLVTEAQGRKSPSERWVDAFARWYTPAVVGAAVLVATVPTLLGVDFSASFYAALALLILACPCALVISTPVAIVSALGRASAAGVLVKGGAHLEQAASIRAVAFDKTGTLTEGRPRVAAIEVMEGSEEDLLGVAATLEAGSEHPLARAIVQEARDRGVSVGAVEGFEALTGLGARGRIDGRTVVIGDPRLFGTLPGAVVDAVDALRARAQTAVVVGVDDTVLGAIGIADTLRGEASEAVSDLRRLGVGSIVLLTGDNAKTAAAMAAAAGIDDVRASLLPQDKAAAIAELGDGVAMVGDGVNDAPALAAASIGFAMGSAGSDTAIEVADVAIMGDDPRKVAGLIGLSRWTKSVVRQNIAFSLGTKLIAAGILAAGALPLWGAVVADVGASLVVVVNGLRLIRGRPAGSLRSVPLLQPASKQPQPVDVGPGGACDATAHAGGCCEPQVAAYDHADHLAGNRDPKESLRG
jgi:Zn2+/Cd2+-exporting ATPase